MTTSARISRRRGDPARNLDTGRGGREARTLARVLASTFAGAVATPRRSFLAVARARCVLDDDAAECDVECDVVRAAAPAAGRVRVPVADRDSVRRWSSRLRALVAAVPCTLAPVDGL